MHSTRPSRRPLRLDKFFVCVSIHLEQKQRDARFVLPTLRGEISNFALPHGRAIPDATRRYSPGLSLDNSSLLFVSSHRRNALPPNGCRLLGVPKAFQKMLQENPQTGSTPVILILGNALRAMSPLGKHKLLPPKAISVAAALGTYATPANGGVFIWTGVLGATVGARILRKLR